MDKLERIRELNSRLAELSADELTELRGLVVGTLDDLDKQPTTKDLTDTMEELATIGEAVMTRQSEIEAEATAAEAKREELKARLAKIANSDEEAAGEGDGGNAGTEGEGEGGEGSGDGEGGEDGEGAGETVGAGATTASAAPRTFRSSPGAMARGTSRATRSPEGGGELRPALTASGYLTGVEVGSTLKDRDAVGRAVANTLNRMSPLDAPRGRVPVFSLDWADQYDSERRFTGDLAANARLADGVTDRLALVASGGICQPLNIDYGLPTQAVADRPLRDGLPAFEASRGGLQYRQPVDFSALANSTGVWTEATDASPSGATKTVMSVSCPSVETVYTAAVTSRLQVGEMINRFDPETVAMYTDLAMVAWANEAELNLLANIASLAVVDVTYSGTVGASREFLAQLDRTIATYKNIHRLGDSQMLTVILPRWFRDMFRADRARELAHDGQSVDPLGITDEYIESLFTLRKVKVIWTLDNAPAVGGGGSTYPLQGWTAFTASAAAPSFPAKLLWYIFVEGALQFLDGGRLDVSVIRDSTLVGTNDFQMFSESFEAVCNRGVSNAVIQCVSTICASGASASSTTTTSACL